MNGSGMNRSDLVSAIIPGDYGKPRPVLIIRSDAFQGLRSATVLPLTTDLTDWYLFRVTVQPDRQNGLRTPSQIMIDKAATVPVTKVRDRIGRLDSETMLAVDRALTRFLGLE
jgi:mRNA interferase MazF